VIGEKKIVLRHHESVVEQVRQLAAPLTSTERLALIQAIAALESSDTQTVRQTRAAADDLAVEQAAWFARPAAERRQFAGHYVAVQSRQVIDRDSDQRALYLRVRERFGTQPVLIVNADWEEPPTLVVRSPRLERYDGAPV
jgi:hypothetical protein